MTAHCRQAYCSSSRGQPGCSYTPSCVVSVQLRGLQLQLGFRGAWGVSKAILRFSILLLGSNTIFLPPCWWAACMSLTIKRLAPRCLGDCSELAALDARFGNHAEPCAGRLQRHERQGASNATAAAPGVPKRTC